MERGELLKLSWKIIFNKSLIHWKHGLKFE